MRQATVARRASLVRARLLARLAARWAVPVTVVSAPAGFGKTTLLRQAMEANRAAPAGIDLLLRCTPRCSAFSSFATALCRTVGAPEPSVADAYVDGVVARVVDALWRRTPEQVALLVDDAHEIPPGSEAARLLAQVVASLPANGHVVLAGRSAPPFPVARLEVEDRLVRIDRDALAFTPAELAEFAALRGVPPATVMSCGGWPALAELAARPPSATAQNYVGEEVLAGLSPEGRRGLALLSHLGSFDEDLARAVIGENQVLTVLGDLPLVEAGAEGEWWLHALWRTLLAHEVSGSEIAEARRLAGVELVRRGEPASAVPLLIDASAWDEVAGAVVGALSAAHPPVARDVLVDWFSKLPDSVRSGPSGQLLAAVAVAEDNPAEACRLIEASVAAFRARGDAAGELTCLVQLGLQAWWSNDPERLAQLAARVMDMESAGCDDAVPFACLGRALLFDLADDSGRMLSELGRIPLGVLNDPWLAIVGWLRAIALLQLGYAAEAEQAAAEAIACGGAAWPGLIESTWLHAVWFQGRADEVFDVLPHVAEHVAESGLRHQIAMGAGQASAAHALYGETDRAVKELDQARAAAVAVSDAPLVDTVLAVAEATLAVVSGDEAAARDHLASYVRKHAIGDGMPVAVQRRYLPLFYVLVPATRPVWDRMELGPAWRIGRQLARAVVGMRENTNMPPPVGLLDDPALVRAHLPPAWVAEVALAAVAAGREDGWGLLDATWSATRSAVVDLAAEGRPPFRRAARTALGRLPAPPAGEFELRLLGPVELDCNGSPVEAPRWRRDRVRSLLTYLAFHRKVSRTQVADDLWPTLHPDAQSRNLRVTLTYLLQVLEPGRSSRAPSFFVRQDGNTLALHPGRWLTVDLWEFDEACERAVAADQRGAPADFLDHATRALGLWRGEPTDALSLPWAVSAFEQRRIRFVRTAIRAGELHLARNHLDRARKLAERALAADPWVEDAHRLLIAAHQTGGDEVALRRAVDRYRASMEEMGVDPLEAARIIQLLKA